MLRSQNCSCRLGVLDMPSELDALETCFQRDGGLVEVVESSRATEGEILPARLEILAVFSDIRWKFLDKDETTLFLPQKTFIYAKRAAAATIDAALHVLREPQPKARAFCMVRPPGHHNSCSDAIEEDFDVDNPIGNFVWGCHGGCILNNVAIAARAVQRESGGKIFILDIDAHFGDGTAILFKDDENILTVSIHEDQTNGYYPFLDGSAAETEHYRSMINVPLPPETDDERAFAILSSLRIAEQLRSFNPDFVFVACGFDGLASDESSTLRFTRHFIPRIMKSLCFFAPAYWLSPGGYPSERAQQWRTPLGLLYRACRCERSY